MGEGGCICYDMCVFLASKCMNVVFWSFEPIYPESTSYVSMAGSGLALGILTLTDCVFINTYCVFMNMVNRSKSYLHVSLMYT